MLGRIDGRWGVLARTFVTLGLADTSQCIVTELREEDDVDLVNALSHSGIKSEGTVSHRAEIDTPGFRRAWSQGS